MDDRRSTQHTCKGSGWHWTYQVVLAFNLESLPSKLVLVSTVLLSTMMVLVFKTEIERWGFLCGPKIWTGIIVIVFVGPLPGPTMKCVCPVHHHHPPPTTTHDT